MKIILILTLLSVAWFIGQSLYTQLGGNGLQAIVDEHAERNTGDAYVSDNFANQLVFLDEAKRDTAQLRQVADAPAPSEPLTPMDWARNGAI